MLQERAPHSVVLDLCFPINIKRQKESQRITIDTTEPLMHMQLSVNITPLWRFHRFCKGLISPPFYALHGKFCVITATRDWSGSSRAKGRKCLWSELKSPTLQMSAITDSHPLWTGHRWDMKHTLFYFILYRSLYSLYHWDIWAPSRSSLSNGTNLNLSCDLSSLSSSLQGENCVCTGVFCFGKGWPVGYLCILQWHVHKVFLSHSTDDLLKNELLFKKHSSQVEYRVRGMSAEWVRWMWTSEE